MNNMHINLLRARKPLVFSIMAIALGVTQSAWSADPARTSSGRITALEAGWAADTVSVQITAPLINPAACPVFNAGYVTSINDPGRKLYQDILKEAFWRGYPVELLISGTAGDCPFGKPRIISVLVRKSF
ncbi:hypothetical protein H6G76_16055 [Nostoc sp. FACHB-152]|uniref:hypothetical protein n=1 Tax=unclassified Nostoc TaxID=2593658 RepID=UPI0016820D07|nr:MULTISPECIES: hypothetical protein [unclassified Nostoc]MBD2448640.1 hypothetical protein [Nostoc sp. FACHB-152]MBD2468374.1 hypothetical protein [Nostoc sp. FACHB-145]